MADKLSERLEALLDSAECTDDAEVTEGDSRRVFVPMTPESFDALLREAAELARRVEGAPVGTIGSVSFEDVRPVWHVMDDRDAVPLNEPKRVRLVPEPPEVG